MDILKWATQIEGDVIAWRRKIYEHPSFPIMNLKHWH
jgi:hypothetical protein